MRLPLGILCVLLAALPASAQQAATPDLGLPSFAARLLVDSLSKGGTRAGARFVALDAATARLLHAAGHSEVEVMTQPRLVCPASTGADGQPVAGETGYGVRIDIRASAVPAERELEIAVGCQFIFRGRDRGFSEGRTWIIQHVPPDWRVVRVAGGWIT